MRDHINIENGEIEFEERNKKFPPVGIMPKWRWDQIRAENLCEAINRYNQAGYPVPKEWVDELKNLAPTVKISKPKK